MMFCISDLVIFATRTLSLALDDSNPITSIRWI